MGEKMEQQIKVLIDQTKLENRIKELAKQIEKDYDGQEVVLIGLLKGSIMFLAELAKNIKGYVQIDFMDVSSYEGTQSTGIIKINKDIRDPIQGKNVIIVEDIIDSGRTLTRVLEHLKGKSPNSIRIATMLSKPSRRVVELEAEYTGFEIEDKFVVGYGLDYNEKYRNLPYVGYIE